MNDKKLNDNNTIVDDGSKCVCSKCHILEHCCPYAADINGDYQSLCNCCEYCSKQCSDNI